MRIAESKYALKHRDGWVNRTTYAGETSWTQHTRLCCTCIILYSSMTCANNTHIALGFCSNIVC